MFDRFRGERDTSSFVHAIRRRWWLVLLIGAIAAGGAYEFSKHKAKQYTATSSLLFTNSQLDQLIVGKGNIGTSGDPARNAATNHALLSLHTVAGLVAHQLHISTGRVLSDLTIGSDSTSDVVSVKVTDPSPVMAAAIANTYVAQYKAFRKETDRNQLTDAETLVNSQLKANASQTNSPTYQRLLSEQQELQLLASLQTGNAEVVQTATVPKSPSSPVPSRDGVIGLLLGLLAGVALVVLLEQRDRRIKTPEEIEELYEVPVVGAIPESKALRGVAIAQSPREQDAFRMIYAQLRYFDVDRDFRRVVVTSADSGEGKSTVALNLARSAASGGDKRVLLIEADLRKPSLMHKLSVEGVAGLAELLTDTHDVASGLRELIVTPDMAPENANGNGNGTFDVLLAGGSTHSSAELLSMGRMSELLAVADEMYDVIIIDTPPMGLVSDPISLVHQVDGLLVVARVGTSHRDHAIRLMKQLRGLNANVLGVVMNGLQTGTGYYYYGYGYGAEETPRRVGVKRRSPTRSR
jgi:capsular exopolysaccharide synthesis family protein